MGRAIVSHSTVTGVRFCVARVRPRMLVAILASCTGCGPAWHSGNEGFTVRHTVQRAVVYGDSLSIQGIINRTLAFTDYGVKVNEVSDDTGVALPFRSFQVFWVKELRFEVECTAPSPSARSVNVNLTFLSRSGSQTVRKKLGILREIQRDYTTGLEAWRTAKPVEP